MTREALWELIVETIKSPQSAAARVIAFQPQTGALWTALLLVAVLNGILYSLLLTNRASREVFLPALVGSPLQLAMFIGAMLALTVFMLTSAGRILGGQGDIPALLRVTIWLQSLRLAAQVLITLVSFLIPLLGWLLAMATMIWGSWILLNFIAVAHRITVPKAIAVLMLSFFGIIVALTIILPIIGVTPPGEI